MSRSLAFDRAFAELRSTALSETSPHFENTFLYPKTADTTVTRSANPSDMRACVALFGLARRDALVAGSLWRQRGRCRSARGAAPIAAPFLGKMKKRVPKTRTKSGSQKKNQNSSPRPWLFENNLWTQTAPEQVPKTVTAFGPQNKNAFLFENKLWTQTVSKQVPSMVTVFGPQNKNAFTTACVVELPRKSCRTEADDAATERRMHRRRRGATLCNEGIPRFWVPKPVPKIRTIACAIEPHPSAR